MVYLVDHITIEKLFKDNSTRFIRKMLVLEKYSRLLMVWLLLFSDITAIFLAGTLAIVFRIIFDLYWWTGLYYQISIVARGMSLGHTLIPPAADRTHETKSRMIEQITAMLGGRAAEEVVFDEMTSGASNDIERATRLARAMVTEFGMSNLGPVNLGPQYDIDEIGKTNFYEPAQVSPEMQKKVDDEIRKIMDASYKKAVEIVKRERKIMDKVVEKLLKVETLDRAEFEKIVGNKK